MTESQFDLFGTEITTSVNQQVASDFTSAGFEPETTPDRHPKHDRESGVTTIDDQSISGTIVSELIAFVEDRKNTLWPKPKTQQNSVARIYRFDAYADHATLSLADITAKHIYNWLDDERKRGLSEASINRYASAMSSVLSLAVQFKLRDDSPKLRYVKTYGRDRFMTANEVEALINHFNSNGDKWMADLVFVGVNTGMRLGEILSLGWVNGGQYSSHYGEAEVRSDHIYLPARITKTGHARRVSINSSVREACVRLQASIGSHFTHRKFYDRWADARSKIAPNDKEFVFHCLRHTCASHMANDLQMNTLIIGAQLGHLSANTTKKYVHVKPDELAKFTQQMTIGQAALTV